MKIKRWLVVLITAFLLTGCGQSASNLPAAEYDSVDSLNEQADALFENGNYTEALLQYADAMRLNPVNLQAVLGSARCQIALENYELAASNLEAAIQIDPEDGNIYDLYTELGQKSEDLDYIWEAISKAETYRVDSFLEHIPDTPEPNLPGGLYNSPVKISIRGEEEAEIHVTEKRGHKVITFPYVEPFSLSRGTTEIDVYCIKDGIPSRKETYSYDCAYPAKEISFADPLIEKMVRTYLGNDTEPITDADCETITELSMYDYRQLAGISWDDYRMLEIHTLDDFALFPNLEMVELFNVVDCDDYSPLRTCMRTLNQLTIYDSQLEDLTFLAGFSNLSYASIYGNHIHDLSPLKECDCLLSLYLFGNPIEDLSAISGLQLDSLGCSVGTQDDLSLIREMKNLRSLTIYNGSSLDLSVLGELTDLTSLEIRLYDYDRDISGYYIARGGMSMKDLSFLSKLQKLEYLSIYELDNYDQVDVFKTLTNLKQLVFYPKTYQSIPNTRLEELQRSLPNCSIYTW